MSEGSAQSPSPLAIPTNVGVTSQGQHRIRLSEQQLEAISREELVTSWKDHDIYLDSLEGEIAGFRELEERLRQQLQEATRRENSLVMRLGNKEQELQELSNQVSDLKAAQAPGATALRTALLDPAVNLLLQKLRSELQATRAKLEETQNELSAWKFTPDSNTGKRLMAKCRLLYQENEELGRMISSGRLAKLEGDLALQKSFSDEVKRSQSELDEFIQDLDEDVEGMQSTIYYLQQELRKSKEQCARLQAMQAEYNAISSEDREGSSTPVAAVAIESSQDVNMEENSMPPMTEEAETASPGDGISRPTYGAEDAVGSPVQVKEELTELSPAKDLPDSPSGARSEEETNVPFVKVEAVAVKSEEVVVEDDEAKPTGEAAEASEENLAETNEEKSLETVADSREEKLVETHAEPTEEKLVEGSADSEKAAEFAAEENKITSESSEQIVETFVEEKSVETATESAEEKVTEYSIEPEKGDELAAEETEVTSVEKVDEPSEEKSSVEVTEETNTETKSGDDKMDLQETVVEGAPEIESTASCEKSPPNTSTQEPEVMKSRPSSEDTESVSKAEVVSKRTESRKRPLEEDEKDVQVNVRPSRKRTCVKKELKVEVEKLKEID